ncbi:hypothetical protein B0A48_03778 [Cryoendolithus antarcticus]|uniref:F-box domain-containing protein n=1 Tax=Cryoendolithus antarcticus TaxID=1507870 RepID=A0A1V8TGV9_9PEZI|nr:hypothetical protein B0A48_03778 [Cryoendolithus antarcticus]
MAPKVLRLSQFQRHRLEAASAAKEAAFHQAAITSGKALLSIPELLGSVLTHLDPKTLLLSQRVSTMWQATVEQSVTLQEKLSFRQQPGEHKDQLNTLLVQRRVRPDTFHYKFKEGTRYYPHQDYRTTWLYAFNLSTFTPESSARKMFLCGYGPMKCPMPEVYSMDFVEDRYKDKEVSGWVFSTSRTSTASGAAATLA